MIDSYEFGKMKIMGEEYDFDLFIIDSEIEPWNRKERHNICLKDLEDISKKCEVLIIGIGDEGCVDVDKEVKEHCKKKKIELMVDRTIIAVENYNDLVHTGKRVCGAFHLTC